MLGHRMHNTNQYDILIVDDTPDSLKILNRMLKERGYRVRPTTNGQHGGGTWAEGKLDRGAAFFFSLPYPRQEGGVEK